MKGLKMKPSQGRIKSDNGLGRGFIGKRKKKRRRGTGKRAYLR
jgi:hypothetical protein